MHTLSYHRGSRGRWTNRPSRRQEPEPTPPPPLGSLVDKIDRDEVSDVTSEDKSFYGIDGTELIASYNWIDQAAPKILVPGKPPLWTPPKAPQILREDDGVYYHDRNAASYSKHPFEPAVVSVMQLHPQAVDVDIFACGSTLGNLLRFVQGEERSFRMLVEVVGGTIHLVRRENSPSEQILGVRGFGHTFPEANTTWEPDVKRSKSHQRIIKYQFSSLNLMIRFEGDGYIKEEASPVTGDRRVHSTGPRDAFDALDDLGGLQLGVSESDLGSSEELTLTHGGQLIDQETIFDLKTRSVRTRETDPLGNQLHRLWVAQIHKFILAYHDSGLFEDIEVRDVWDRVLAWESSNQSSLRNLSMLLHRIKATALATDTKLELVRQDDGPLEIRTRLADAGEVFSERVRQQWEEWLNDGESNDVEKEKAPDGTSHLRDDSDSEEDFTACDEECGYCGKCRG